MYYVYNGFYVFDFIAHCWATFSALCALLSNHIMTNKDDDDDVSKILQLLCFSDCQKVPDLERFGFKLASKNEISHSVAHLGLMCIGLCLG